MKWLKKNAFWVIIALVVVGVGLWYYFNNKPGQTETDTKTDDGNGNSTNKQEPVINSPSSAASSGCGTMEEITQKFATDQFFRNQPLGPAYRGKNKCQTMFLQTVLNSKEKAGLTVDGDFGPKTLAAVQKAFKKEQVNLNDVDQKYLLTSTFKTPGAMFSTLMKTF